MAGEEVGKGTGGESPKIWTTDINKKREIKRKGEREGRRDR